MLTMLLLGALLGTVRVSGQSNYASHANNIGYLGEGLPEEATLDGKVPTNATILASKDLIKTD